MSAPRVYVIHENPEWIAPIAGAFDAARVPWSEWLMTGGRVDLSEEPPDGVFWSRLSASAHTRDHAGAKEQARAVLSWLDAHGRRVVNGRRILELELSKVDQLAQLAAHGFDVPRTVAVSGTDELSVAAKEFTAPFISKPNQGGKGLGVRRWDSHDAFDAAIAELEPPVDGITLLQEYVAAAEPRITRVELVAGRFLYALTADTARGGFELCPADACAVDPDTSCVLDGDPGLFALREDLAGHPIVAAYEAFAADVGLEVAGLEFIETADGRVVTYDINTNTNYNPAVDAVAPRSGPATIAAWLRGLLDGM